MGVALWMLACAETDAEPKVIHADGETYIACGGVLSVHSAPGTDEGFFRDPHGAKHHLSKIRSLTITNFEGDTPECKAAR